MAGAAGRTGAGCAAGICAPPMPIAAGSAAAAGCCGAAESGATAVTGAAVAGGAGAPPALGAGAGAAGSSLTGSSLTGALIVRPFLADEVGRGARAMQDLSEEDPVWWVSESVSAAAVSTFSLRGRESRGS